MPPHGINDRVVKNLEGLYLEAPQKGAFSDAEMPRQQNGPHPRPVLLA